MTEIEFNEWVIENNFDAPGYQEKAALENEPHTHDRTVAIMVKHGNFGLEVNGERKNYSPGDHFTLEANIVHREIFEGKGVGYFYAWRTD